jgi:hypothetical protein
LNYSEGFRLDWTAFRSSDHVYVQRIYSLKVKLWSDMCLFKPKVSAYSLNVSVLFFPSICAFVWLLLALFRHCWVYLSEINVNVLWALCLKTNIPLIDVILISAISNTECIKLITSKLRNTKDIEKIF